MKKSLLLVIPFPALPVRSGGQARLCATIPLLAKHYQIHLVELRPLAWPKSAELDAFYQMYCQSVTIVERYPKQHFSYFFTGIPYWFSDYWNPELAWLLPEMIRKYSIDFVQVEFSQLLYVFDFLPKNMANRFIAHDIATLSFWRRLLEESKLWKWPVHLKRFFEVATFEKKYLAKVKEIVAVSSVDQAFLQKKFPKQKVLLQNNGISACSFLSKRPAREIRLGFIGSLEHGPNQVALREILGILSKLTQETDQPVSFYLAGKNSTSDLKKLFGSAVQQIHNLGELNESKSFYENIDILIVPLKSGSGSRIKILESLSFGRPVIATAIAAEGLEIVHPFLKIVTKSDWPTAIREAKELEIADAASTLKKALEPYLWEKQDIDES